MKRLFLLAVVNLLSIPIFAQNNIMPGEPQREQPTVTSVVSNSGVEVRKVRFMRSNGITLIGNLFLPKNFDASKKYATKIGRAHV